MLVLLLREPYLHNHCTFQKLHHSLSSLKKRNPPLTVQISQWLGKAKHCLKANHPLKQTIVVIWKKYNRQIARKSQAVILFCGSFQNLQNNVWSCNTKQAHNTNAFRKICFIVDKNKLKVLNYLLFKLAITLSLKLMFKTFNSFFPATHSHHSTSEFI